MNGIRTYFDKYYPLREEEWLAFSCRLQMREFAAKEKILEQGEVENYLSFIETGIVRYYIEGEESEMTFAFIFENEFSSAYDSFLTRQACIYNVEAISNIRLWRIHYDELQEVYNSTAAGNAIGRLAAENLFLIKFQRELSLLNESAQERYVNLFNSRPNLIRLIPLKYIASYIGVTPQALSRIRRRIS